MVIRQRFGERRNPQKGLDMDTKAFTIDEFTDTYKVGRTIAYEEIASGRLKTYKLGRRRYISANAAADWQRRLEAESNPAEAVVA